MKDVPENELFSAYLDGELTAAEQAEVEQLLAASPAARQLLEELRTLSSTLQTMPQHKLPEDLSERVLRIAERRILTESAGPEKLPKPAFPVVGKLPCPHNGRPGRSILRRVFSPRALAWSGVAVAVALLLMVWDPGQPDQPAGRRVAMAPETAEKGGEHPSIQTAAESAEHRDQQPVPEADSDGTPASPVLTSDFAPGTAGSKTGPGGISKTGPTPLPERGMARKPATKNGLAEQAMNQKPSGAGIATRRPTSGQPAPGGPPEGEAPTGGRQIADPVNGSAAGRIAAKSGRPVIGKVDSHYMLKLGKESGASLYGVVDGSAQFGVNGSRAAQSGQFSLVSGGCALVYCDISPEAVGKQSIDHLLAANGIALEETRGNMVLAPDHRAYFNRARQHQREGEQLQAQKRDAGGVTLGGRADAQNLDVLYVVATPHQIEATLADLKALPNAFLSLSVRPAPGVEAQKGWGRYSRPGAEAEPRQGGEARSEPADDLATTGATISPVVVTPKKGGLEHKLEDKEEDKDNQPLGRAVRLRVAGPTLRAGLYSRALGFRGAGLGSAVQQQLKSGTPTPSTAEALQATADQPAAPPPAAEQPGKAPAVARQTAEGAMDVVGKRAVQRADTTQEEFDAKKAREPQEPVNGEDYVAPPRRASKDRQGGQRQKADLQRTAADEAKVESELRERQKLLELMLEDERSQQRRPIYHVLIVLQMVDPDLPAAAASRIEASDLPAAEATPEAEQQ